MIEKVLDSLKSDVNRISPHRTNILGLLGIFLVTGVLLALGSWSHTSPHEQEALTKPLQHEVSVTLKLIQVYVTDKGGKPVRDLTKDEFILTDNGKLVTITEFEKYDRAPVSPEIEAPPLEVKPAPESTEIPTIPRKFIILFDFAYNTHKGVAGGVKAALDFLDTKVGPEDETAFISYSMLKGLKVHESLTSDHARVRKAVASVTAKESSGRADEVERAYWQLVELAQVNQAAQEELVRMEMQRQDSSRQAQNYLLTLTRLAQALRLVQGQKNVLFFSNGIPTSLVNSTRTAGGRVLPSRGTVAPGSGGSGRTPGSTFEIGNSVLRPLQETMLKEFSASNCSFYTFDTREASKLASFFAYDEMKLRTGVGGLTDPFRDDKTTGMDSLRRLSRQTGGKYYSNIIRYEKNFEEVVAITGTYYVLGYPIPAAADGKFHDIKIEVKRKGVQVRMQPGYFNPKPFREYTDLEKNIHLFDLALNERSDFQIPKLLSISALSYSAGQGPRVQALVHIPKEAWEQFGGTTAELVALFFDAQDDLLSLQRIAISLADYVGKEVLFTAGASPRPGDVKCRIVIRDLETGRSAVASAKIYIGRIDSQNLYVHTPMLIVMGGGLFHLEGVVKEISESLSWREIYAYDSLAYSPIIGGETVSVNDVGVIVPYLASGVNPTDVIIKTNLINSASGENLSVPFELRESSKRGTLDVQKLEISLEKVPPGTYLLYVHVGDKASGAISSNQVPLTVGR